MRMDPTSTFRSPTGPSFDPMCAMPCSPVPCSEKMRPEAGCGIHLEAGARLGILDGSGVRDNGGSCWNQRQVEPESTEIAVASSSSEEADLNSLAAMSQADIFDDLVHLNADEALRVC